MTVVRKCRQFCLDFKCYQSDVTHSSNCHKNSKSVYRTVGCHMNKYYIQNFWLTLKMLYFNSQQEMAPWQRICNHQNRLKHFICVDIDSLMHAHSIFSKTIYLYGKHIFSTGNLNSETIASLRQSLGSLLSKSINIFLRILRTDIHIPLI